MIIRRHQTIDLAPLQRRDESTTHNANRREVFGESYIQRVSCILPRITYGGSGGGEGLRHGKV